MLIYIQSRRVMRALKLPNWSFLTRHPIRFPNSKDQAGGKIRNHHREKTPQSNQNGSPSQTSEYSLRHQILACSLYGSTTNPAAVFRAIFTSDGRMPGALAKQIALVTNSNQVSMRDPRLKIVHRRFLPYMNRSMLMSTRMMEGLAGAV